MANEDQGARLNNALAQALRLIRFAYSVPAALWHDDDHRLAHDIAELLQSDAWVFDIGDSQIRLIGTTGEGLRNLLREAICGLIDAAPMEVRPMTAEEREAELEGDDEPR